MTIHILYNWVFFSINCILTHLGRGLKAIVYQQTVHQICNKQI